MNNKLLVFIGGGNMAQALIGGALKAGQAPSDILVIDPNAEQRARCEATLSVRTKAEITDQIEHASLLVLAVKPQVMSQALATLAPCLGKTSVVVSVAAGVTLTALAAQLPENQPVVRAMPNTPALYGAGITGLVASTTCSGDHRALAEGLLRGAGKCVWLDDEALMDAVTAVSGSGPAYFFRFVEALAQAGENAGLPSEVARTLARETATGAGIMLARSELAAGELRRQVTSPGGTTQAALEQFEADRLTDIVDNAVKAAVRRGQELGKG